MIIRNLLRKKIRLFFQWILSLFDTPQLIEVRLCQKTHLLFNDKCCDKLVWGMFAKGNEPKEVCQECCREKAKKVVREICVVSGLLAGPYCPISKRKKKVFVEGKEPKKYCNIHTKLKVKPSKLIIRDGILYFKNGGEEPLIGFGVSRREILHRALKLWFSLYGKSLEWFEKLYPEYGLNFERIDAVSDYKFLKEHCERMYKYGVVVEVTLIDRIKKKIRKDMGDPRLVIDALKDLPNVIFEPVNELYSEEDVRLAQEWCSYIEKYGLISSAGAYGAGGEKWSKSFDPVKSSNKVITIHRYYGNSAEVKNTIQPYKRAGKPMDWNESFRITAKKWGELVEVFYKEGVRLFNYYGLRSKELFPDLKTEDPNRWQLYYEKAGELCKKYN